MEISDRTKGQTRSARSAVPVAAPAETAPTRRRVERPALCDDGARLKPSPRANHSTPQASSPRAFGWVFCGVFALLTAWLAWRGSMLTPGAAAVSFGFGSLALFAPQLLRLPNRAWFHFGLLLHKIVSPLILGMLFFAVIVPIALLMRAFGRDQLARRYDAAADTYWVSRPPDARRQTMNDQF